MPCGTTRASRGGEAGGWLDSHVCAGGPASGLRWRGAGGDTAPVVSAEPSFVFADVIRRSPNEGQDDRVYFFFTEASVEYEFVFKLMIPRVARVCRVSAGRPPRTLAPAWVMAAWTGSLWLWSDRLLSLPLCPFVPPLTGPLGCQAFLSRDFWWYPGDQGALVPPCD